jgi:hypothetical protein
MSMVYYLFGFALGFVAGAIVVRAHYLDKMLAK